MTYYGVGLLLKVIYNWEGVEKTSNCILAQTFDKEELFQVIENQGYYAGYIKGYIKKQFNDDKSNFCTWNHLESELKERVFGEILSIEILEENTVISDKEIKKLRKIIK